MKKLMLFAVAAMMAGSAIAQLVENGGFETEGMNGVSSAQYWDGATMANLTSGSDTGNWGQRDSSFDPSRPWVMTFDWSGGQNVWQEHQNASALAGYEFTFGGDFYVESAYTGPITMRLSFANPSAVWTSYEIDLASAYASRDTWVSLNVVAPAPLDMVLYRITLEGGSTFSGSAHVDNICFNAVAPVPEPATMSLLGLGALAMVLRRKIRK